MQYQELLVLDDNVLLVAATVEVRGLGFKLPHSTSLLLQRF
jgi:hypothetical protein